MGRAKTYDRVDVTRKAMGLFWRAGYEATSTKALAEHMGINVYSLFAEFESKQGLYESALELYRKEIVAVRFEALQQDNAGLEEIIALLNMFCAYADTPDSAMGCLMCNTAAERSPNDPVSREIASENFKYNTKAICNALENAKRRGEIAKSVCCEDESKMLTATLIGLQVLLRAGTDADFIHAAIRAASAQVEALRA